MRPISCAARSAGSRLISRIEEPPSSTNPSSPSITSEISIVRTSSRVNVSSNRRTNGPSERDGVVVLGLAEQQRGAAFEIAQVDVVAERRADDRAARRRSAAPPPARDCSSASGVDADVGAAADRRHRLRLGEDLGVRADADLEILRPDAVGDQRVLQLLRLGEPGFNVARSVPISLAISSRMRSAPARSPRARSSITRSSIETAKVTPAALTACRSIGDSSQGRFGVARFERRVGEDILERAQTLARARRARRSPRRGPRRDRARSRRPR